MTPPRTRATTPSDGAARSTPARGGPAASPAKAAATSRATTARPTASRATTSRTASSTASTPRASASRTAAGTTGRRRARRIGIMGGTFDPIHHGHLVAASEVASRFLLDEVVFVPTGQPWQKADYEVSTAEDRYLMTVIATASNPRFHVSRVDVDRGGPTYTVDTLRDLRALYGPKVDLFFITGADALDKILSWKDADQIFELAHLVGVTRPGFVLSDAHLPGATVSLVQVPAMAISSTDCRRRVAEGQPVWYLVPDGVAQYIAKRHLYRPAAGTP
jgi:nicotinate-nucleotide adenylyltransferase